MELQIKSFQESKHWGASGRILTYHPKLWHAGCHFQTENFFPICMKTLKMDLLLEASQGEGLSFIWKTVCLPFLRWHFRTEFYYVSKNSKTYPRAQFEWSGLNVFHRRMNQIFDSRWCQNHRFWWFYLSLFIDLCGLNFSSHKYLMVLITTNSCLTFGLHFCIICYFRFINDFLNILVYTFWDLESMVRGTSAELISWWIHPSVYSFLTRYSFLPITHQLNTIDTHIL